MVSTFWFRLSTSSAVLDDVGLGSPPSARTVISTGSRWYTQEISITSREMVAENMPRFLPCLGIWSRMRVTSRTKPMSSIRSASSSTTVSTLSSRTVRRFIWSIRRPGVATTIWGFFFSWSDLLVDGLPAVEAHGAHPLLERAQVPQLVLDLDGQLPGGGQHQAVHLGRPAGSTCSTIGMPKAKVLPVPVGALAMTSFHSMK